MSWSLHNPSITLKTQENLVPPRQGHRESTAQSPIPQLHMRQELHVIDITVPTAISVHLGTGSCDAELPTGLQESRWPHAFTMGQIQVLVQAQPHNVLQRNKGLPESASKADCIPRQCRRGVHHCFFQSPAAAPQPQPKSHHFPTFWAIQLHPRLLQAGEHRASYMIICTSC